MGQSPDRPRIGSMFSGAGGLDLAVQHVFDGEVLWHAETEPAACKVLEARWPGVPNLGDVTEVDWSEVPPVDILVGGFPCQDLSMAGRKKGMGAHEDGTVTRSGLWIAMAIAIAQLCPVLVVIENVRGLLSSRAHRYTYGGNNGDGTQGGLGPHPADLVEGGQLRGLGRVLGDLADLGYDAHWDIVAAAQAGAPHKRERVFVLAYPRELAWSDIASVITVPQQGREFSRSSDDDLVLLSTPQSRDHKGIPSPNFNMANLCRDVGEYGTESALLPTPMTVNRTSQKAQTGRPTSGPQRGGPSYGLEDVVLLLPTPLAHEAKGTGPPESRGRNTPDLACVEHSFTPAPPETTTPEGSDLLPTPCVVDRMATGTKSNNLRITLAQVAEGNDATSKGRSSQILRDMRDSTDSQTVCEWTIGGPHGISEAPPLFPSMCQQSDNSTGRFASLASKTVDALGLLRGLRDEREVARSSRGSESCEQSSRQPASALQQLSSEAALARGPRVQDAADQGGRWGRYEAAIRRWEAILGRTSPDPTELSKNGNPRLNPEFASWMMGWPKGWVSDLVSPLPPRQRPEGMISCNDALKIIGNGVCPQQAVLALYRLMSVTEPQVDISEACCG